MRDLAKREGTHSGRSSNMNSQTNLHVEIYTVTHRHGHVYTHALTCAQIHKHYTCIDNTHTHTDMYFYMFTNVYTLTQKPTIQYTDMSLHRHRPDTDTHKYTCAHAGTHRCIYAHRCTYVAIQIHTHTSVIRDETRCCLTQR